MKYFNKQNLTVFSLVFVVAAFIFAGNVSAHVTVKPAEVPTSAFQTFVVGVPNEKDIPTTIIKLEIPSGLKYVSPTTKPGWQIDIEKDGTGEDTTVKSITWTAGTIDEDFRDEFTFSAQAPAQAGELQWKAYQTYSDGTVVSWDQPESSEGHEEESSNSGPFSVTKVVAETNEAAAISDVQKTANEANDTADRALYVGIAGVVVGLIAIAIALLRRR